MTTEDMGSQLSQFQIEFRDTVRRFLNEQIPIERVRSTLKPGKVRDAALWEACETLGLTSGFGGADPAFGFRELGLLAYETGRGLVPEPIVYHNITCEFLPRLLTLEGAAVPADFFETPGRALGTVTFADASKFQFADHRVTGAIPYVPFGEFATHVLVRSGEGRSRALTLLKVTGAGVQRTALPSIDHTVFLARLDLQNVSAVHLPESLTAQIDAAIAMIISQEIAGICGRVIELSKTHVTQREQFGVPVGGFQAVQHALATSFTNSEAASALADFAGWALDESPAQASLSSASALSYALEVGAGVVETAIQVHGGMGFTWEHDLHLYLRRVKYWESLLSNSSDLDIRVLNAAIEAMRE